MFPALRLILALGASPISANVRTTNFLPMVASTNGFSPAPTLAGVSPREGSRPQLMKSPGWGVGKIVRFD